MRRAAEVCWAHAANSHAALAAALDDRAIDMIEADVILGAGGEPIMAHPPQTSRRAEHANCIRHHAHCSDLALDQFLEAVKRHNSAFAGAGIVPSQIK